MIIGYPNKYEPNNDVVLNNTPMIIKDCLDLNYCILYYPSIYKTVDVYNFNQMKNFLMYFKLFTIIIYAYSDHVKFWFRL